MQVPRGFSFESRALYRLNESEGEDFDSPDGDYRNKAPRKASGRRSRVVVPTQSDTAIEVRISPAHAFRLLRTIVNN